MVIPLHFISFMKTSLDNKLNDQNQVFRFLCAIWPKSKDLYPTYLKATQPSKDLRTHQLSLKFARLACIQLDI